MVETSTSKGHSLLQLWEESVQTAQASKPRTQEQQLELPHCALPPLKSGCCVFLSLTPKYTGVTRVSAPFFLSGIT